MIVSGQPMQRMFERGISRDDALAVIARGETIAEYADDQPHPSRLLLGSVETKPLHVVVAFNEAAGLCIVVTVCEPALEHSNSDYRTGKMK